MPNAKKPSPLSSREDFANELTSVYRDARNGKISSKEGRNLAQILDCAAGWADFGRGDQGQSGESIEAVGFIKWGEPEHDDDF